MGGSREGVKGVLVLELLEVGAEGVTWWLTWWLGGRSHGAWIWTWEKRAMETRFHVLETGSLTRARCFG